MRNFDLTPLYRTTVGFDRLAGMLDQVLSADGSQQGYPPYNIEKTGDHSWRITLAVAGFSLGDLDIEARDGMLVIKGGKAPEAEGKGPVYLHRGIAERSFERRFQLADHVRAEDAHLENGLLHIELHREIPEALKPRKIEIGAVKESQAKRIDG